MNRGLTVAFMQHLLFEMPKPNCQNVLAANQASSQALPETRIYRVNARERAWRAQFNVAGKKHERVFSDKDHGGPEQSLAAAKRFTAQCEAYEDLLELRRRFQIRKNSRSGVPGVTRVEARKGRRAFWMAYWDDPATGRKKSRRFSVDDYGDMQAMALAIEHRERAMHPLRHRYAALWDAAQSFEPDAAAERLVDQGEGARHQGSVSSGDCRDADRDRARRGA